jgi:hypothetical protein
MGKLHSDLMKKVEVVGHKASTALQAGCEGDNEFGSGGNLALVTTAGGSDSVSTMTNCLLPLLSQVVAGVFSFLHRRYPFMGSCRFLFSKKDVVHAHHSLVLWE